MTHAHPVFAAGLPLAEKTLALARADYLSVLAKANETAGSLLDALAATRARWGAPRFMLAVSGGTDSALLAMALGGARFPRAVTLAVAPDSRDLLAARRLGATLGFSPEPLFIDENGLRAIIARHAGLLRELPDYTQRILAVCELFLARAAAERGAALVTGHGPEAILGGFHRRAAPAADDHDAMLDRLFLNLRRLNCVASACRCEIRLPFLEPEVLAAIAALRRAGRGKEDVILSARPDLPLPAKKSSLQNGAGAHYLFVRMARRAGARHVRDYMETLVS